MSRAEKIFRNKLGNTYMTRQIIGRSSVNESELDLYNDIDDRDESLSDRIKWAVKKLNRIRQQCINMDPDYDEVLLNAEDLDITERTLDTLEDMIEDERRLLDTYMQQDDDDDYNQDVEPDARSLRNEPAEFDDDISDEDLFDEPETPMTYSTKYDEDSDEARFLAAMDDQLALGEEDRDVFWLGRKSDPDTDYLVTVITKFKDNSFFFNILKVDDEECNKTVRIALSDIDLDNTEY